MGTGADEGSSSDASGSTGNAYQQSNFYADMREGESHPTGPAMGHTDFDIESDGAVENPVVPASADSHSTPIPKPLRGSGIG